MRMGIIAVLAAALSALPAKTDAAVRVEEKSEWQLGGVLGKVASLVGRRAPEAETTTIAATTSRKVSMSRTAGEIIDLDEGAVYQLDLENRTYTLTTFEELRRRVEVARREVAPSARKEEPRSEEPRSAEPAPNELLQHLEIEVTIENTGRTRAINGFDTRELVMRVTAHEKGKTLEVSGGLALTSSMWLAARIGALKELNAFDQRYARKLAGAIFGEPAASDPAASPSAAAVHPMLKDVLVRMRAEGTKMEGAPILTTTTVDLVPSAEQRAAERKAPPQREPSRSPGKGVRGLLGGLVSQAVEKRVEERRERSGDEAAVTIFRMTNEVMSVSSDVTAADLALPAGFRRVR